LHQNIKKISVTVAFAATVVLAFGGCASNTGSSSGSGPTASVASSAVLATAASNVQKYSDLQGATFPMPTDKFNPGTGTVAVIAGGFAAPVHFENANTIAATAKIMGWKALGPYDGQFSPAVQGGFVDEAVQRGADGIVIVSTDIDSISASVDRALTAKVSVSCVMCNTSQAYRDKGVIDASVNFTNQGDMMAWYLIDKSQGGAKVAGTVEPAATTTVAREAGLKKTLSDNCPTCTYQSLTIPAAASTLPGPPQWTAFLAANPKGITDAVAYYDGLSSPMLTTLTSSGRTDITTSGYDASQEIVNILLAGGKPFGATIAAPYEYADWAALDLVARQKAGAPMWDATNIPSALITHDNAGSYQPYFSPAGDWQSKFLALWGKN
jgi:ABC-type sugar transport system substrate-binding protein